MAIAINFVARLRNCPSSHRILLHFYFYIFLFTRNAGDFNLLIREYDGRGSRFVLVRPCRYLILTRLGFRRVFGAPLLGPTCRSVHPRPGIATAVDASPASSVRMGTDCTRRTDMIAVFRPFGISLVRTSPLFARCCLCCPENRRADRRRRHRESPPPVKSLTCYV